MKIVNREKEILPILKEFVGIKSRTGTHDENLGSDFIFNFISNLVYFKKNPEHMGKVSIPGDPFNRTIPYGFIKGNSNNTVILSGHFDVVDEFDYKDAKELAFTIGDELVGLLSHNDMNETQRADFESNGWIWGKGAADMKGGLTIHMDILREFSQLAMEGKLNGSIVFMGVCDEESYSQGMRYGVKILSSLKDEYGLNYKLLINPEPTDLVHNKQIMAIGSVGKLMPVVVVQGVTSHVGHCFDGFNPLSVLSKIYDETNGALEFSDAFEGEASMPPTWIKMRDLKEIYDASIPLRAGGYFTVLSFTSSPKIIMDKLLRIANDVAKSQIQRVEINYENYKKINKFEIKQGLGFNAKVYDFNGLIEELEAKRGEEFHRFYEGAYEEVKGKIYSGDLNFPDGTMMLMEKVMEFANFTQPVVVISFAPPYYPAVYGGENSKKAYNIISELSKEFDVQVDYQNYFPGISDNSYSNMSFKMDSLEVVKSTTPLWGQIYSIDFDAILNVNVPAIIYGPIGRDYHKWAERVHKDSLFRVVPSVTRELIKKAWKF